MCCSVRDTKETFFFLTFCECVSRVSNFIRTREKSNKCVRYLAREDINLWQRVQREWFRVSESHTFSFLRSLSRSFFFFCLRTIKFFSRLSKLYYSCVFLGDFITCGVHVREGFCEKGVFFNEHNNTTRFTKKSREKLFLVSSFFVVT